MQYRVAAESYQSQEILPEAVIPSILSALLRRHLRTQALLLVSEFGRKLVTEVFRFEHLANLDFSVFERGALEPLERLLLRRDLPDPEARDQIGRASCRERV